MASSTAKGKRDQHCEYCDKVVPSGNRARHYRKQFPEIEQANNGKTRHHGEVEEPKRVSGWLEYCGVNLSTCEVP